MGTNGGIKNTHYVLNVLSINIYAGNAMGRRASYQCGTLLQNDEQGALSIGIGMGQGNEECAMDRHGHAISLFFIRAARSVWSLHHQSPDPR